MAKQRWLPPERSRRTGMPRSPHSGLGVIARRRSRRRYRPDPRYGCRLPGPLRADGTSHFGGVNLFPGGLAC